MSRFPNVATNRFVLGISLAIAATTDALAAQLHEQPTVPPFLMRCTYTREGPDPLAFGPTITMKVKWDGNQLSLNDGYKWQQPISRLVEAERTGAEDRRIQLAFYERPRVINDPPYPAMAVSGNMTIFMKVNRLGDLKDVTMLEARFRDGVLTSVIRRTLTDCVSTLEL